METVKIKYITDIDNFEPAYAHDGDMCADLKAISMDYDIEKDIYVYHTGIKVEIPKGYGMLIFPRSSNRRTEAYMTNHVGVIDSGYRGEILVCFKNRTSSRLAHLYRKLVHGINTILSYLEKRNDLITENFVNTDAPYKVGERIAQCCVIPYPKMIFEKVDKLSESERGENGHGSTGK